MLIWKGESENHTDGFYEMTSHFQNIIINMNYFRLESLRPLTNFRSIAGTYFTPGEYHIAGMW